MAGWENIRDDVVQFMQQVRTERLIRERRVLLCSRLKLLSEFIAEYESSEGPRTAETDWQPHFADVAMHPTFRALADAPDATQITKEDFVAVSDEIPVFMKSWFAERQAEFVSMAAQAVDTLEDASLLTLAISTFGCQRCRRKDLRWPGVLSHACARSSQYSYSGNGEDDVGYRNVISRDGQIGMWTGMSLFVFNPNLKEARAVITACGKNPDRVSYEEMEACGVRLVCKGCRRTPEHYEVFDWKSGVRNLLWVL